MCIAGRESGRKLQTNTYKLRVFQCSLEMFSDETGEIRIEYNRMECNGM